MVEEQDSSVVTELEGYDSKYSPSDFKEYLNADLSSKAYMCGWIFWRPAGRYELSESYQTLYHRSNPTSYKTDIKDKIISILANIDSNGGCSWANIYSDGGSRRRSLIQFWAPKVEGQHHYLTTSDQPFWLDNLYKGLCWYRKQCMDHHYVVEEGASEEQFGPVGRVYRNKRPESSQDLRLYSANEFPLRDHVARCGLRNYLALPVCDLLNNECYGVLELLSLDYGVIQDLFFSLDRGLQEAEFRSNHIHFFPTSRVRESMEHRHAKDQQVQYVSDGADCVRSAAQASQCTAASDNYKKEDKTKKTERGKRKNGVLLIKLEDLKPHFGKRLRDVAQELGVGRSTIKRACRYYGVHRWPCNEKHKKNPSLFETKIANESARDSQPNAQPSSSSNLVVLDMPLFQNVPQTNTEINQLLTVQVEVEKVTVKAKYEDGIIKFQLCVSSGMDKLFKEVATRLNLKMGSFKLKYVDEDNDEILLACDVDLQLCLKSLTAAVDKTCIHLFVQLIHK